MAAFNLPEHTEAFRLAGVGAICVSGGVWLALLLTAERVKPTLERGYVLALDAGAWLYDNGTPALRDTMREGVPIPFQSMPDQWSAFVCAAAESGAFQLYGRRATGLKLEPITPAEARPSSIKAILGNALVPHDVCIKRRALKALRLHYKI